MYPINGILLAGSHVAVSHISTGSLRLMSNFPPLSQIHLLKRRWQRRSVWFVVQELCLIMSVNSLRCVCIHVHRSGETRRSGIIHTCSPHGSPHRQPWHRVVRHSCLWFTVLFCVCSALFTDHSPHRSIERGVRAANMNNRFFLSFLRLRIPILSGGKRLRRGGIFNGSVCGVDTYGLNANSMQH